VPYITDYLLDELNEVRTEVKNAYGECIVKDSKISYISEPSSDLTESERRESLERLLDLTADILDEYEEEGG
jgi:transcriptional/translational regulatory protein YebC/TACO1